MKFSIIIVLAALAFAMQGLAQGEKIQPGVLEKADPPNPPNAHVTIIALGPIAKKRYRIAQSRKQTDISRVEGGAEKGREIRLPELLPPRAGESPPPLLYYKGGKKGKLYEKVRVGFNNPSSMNSLTPNRAYHLYRRNENTGEGYEHYFTIPALLEGSQTLMLLTQKTRRLNRWFKKPIVHAIDFNSDTLRDAVLYLKNLSSERVYIKIGDEKGALLMPGAGYVYPGGSGQRLIQVLAGKGRQGRVPLIRTGVRVPKGNLTTFVFYNADPATNSGKSVGACRVVTTRIRADQKHVK